MLSYQARQEQLFNDLETSFKQGATPSTVVSSTEDFLRDPRRCLAGVSFLPQELQKEIRTRIITPLQAADPRQYYYLPESLHMTIKNVRASTHPPTFGDREIELATQAFRVVPRHSSFSFELRGLFELPTSLAIRAYSGSELRDLVLDLSSSLERASVPDDKQYASDEVFFGNATIARYTTPPNQEFFEQVARLKNEPVGTFTLDQVSLITTNAVAHPAHTRIIQEFQLA